MALLNIGAFPSISKPVQFPKQQMKCKAAAGGNRTPPTADANLSVKLVWHLSEAFGNVASVFRTRKLSQQAELDVSKDVVFVSREMVSEAIRNDYAKSYFVTGDMSSWIYLNECEFADPFVSFKGLKRFRQNVSNLGSFIEKASLRIADWKEGEDSILVKWRFNCVLGLPWKPIIAATGNTEYFLESKTGKICKHVERWDITPTDGVRQLFKPSRLAR